MVYVFTRVLRFPDNTVIAWIKDNYHEQGNIIITLLLLPLGHISNMLHLPTSLHVDISLLLCPAHTSTGFYVLYLWWVYVSSTSPSNLILITLLQFLCHRDAHLDFGETAQNDPMVKRLQTSFIRKLERCQQIEAWSGFTVQGLGTAWIVFFFSCLCSKISVNFSSSTTLY